MNRANWNSRVPHHVHGYDLEVFREDPAHLWHVMRFDYERLGSGAGHDVVHLQCHLGTDTLSLSRLGARRVTGLDFSAPALEVAARLAHDCDANIEYVLSELYGAVDALGPERFDLVYTGLGALCWLPDIRQWAQVVAQLLRPGGRLFLREGHPVLWSLGDPREDGLLVEQYPNFEAPGVPFVEDHSYVAHDEPLVSPRSISFNHGIGELVTALMDAGLTLTSLQEHRSIPWNALGNLKYDDGTGEFRLSSGSNTVPLSYTLQASKCRSAL